MPAPLLDLWRLTVAGTAIWLVALVILLISGYAPSWRWISLAGFLLGLLGLSVMWWQRRASRSGARGAQRGL